MTLIHMTDPSAADWLTERAQPWPKLAGFGPPVFAAYARLRFIPDPTAPGQQEGDVPDGECDVPSRLDQLRLVTKVLRGHTATPEDSYHCLWEGVANDIRGDGRNFRVNRQTGEMRELPRAQPAFAPEVLAGPMVRLENCDYFLFRGSLSEVGQWGAADSRPGLPRDDLAPAFVWPADRAWCLASDSDPHWAGIGASTEVIDELIAWSGLDIVAADPTQPQPYYG